MSFGFSVGDFVAILNLAWQVYKSCKDAPGSFRNISQEVLSLHAVLKEVEETLLDHPIPPSKEAGLATVTDGCKDVLQNLQSLVIKYESLGSNTKSTWDRMRWHSDDIAELRARLTSNIVLLTAYISTSQIVVERQLKKFMQEFREGKHEPSVVTTQTIESLSIDKKETWRTIRKELEEIGISVAAFDANKVFIMEWLKNAISIGAFEDQSFEDDSGSTSQGDWLLQPLGDSVTGESGNLSEEAPHLRSNNIETPNAISKRFGNAINPGTPVESAAEDFFNSIPHNDNASHIPEVPNTHMSGHFNQELFWPMSSNVESPDPGQLGTQNISIIPPQASVIPHPGYFPKELGKFYSSNTSK